MKARKPSEVVAQQVGLWRRRRGLSARELAERMRALGWIIDRTAITNIELGKRGVGLDEGLVLAAALNVPPPVFLLGLGDEERVAVTPRSQVHPDLARRWLTGEGPLATTGRTALGGKEWQEAAAAVQAFDRLRQLQEIAHKAHSLVQSAEYVGDPEPARKARERFGRALRNLATLYSEQDSLGLRLPALPLEWRDAMKKLGLLERGQG